MNINNIQSKVSQQHLDISKEISNISDMTGQLSNTMNDITSARSTTSGGGFGNPPTNNTPMKRDFNMNNIKVMKPSPQQDNNSYGGNSMMNQNKVRLSILYFHEKTDLSFTIP